MPAAAPRRYSYAEYLAHEAGSLEKNEFLDGVILAMAGGTPEHSRQITNLLVALGIALDGRPCQPYESNLRIRVLATGLATYPDVSVICGDLQLDPEDPNGATNPTVLCEALSPSTAGYDHGEKFDHYKQIPSLRHYVLVDHARVHVDVYTLEAGEWIRRGYGAGERIPLPAIAVEIPVDKVYRGWTAPEPARALKP